MRGRRYGCKGSSEPISPPEAEAGVVAGCVVAGCVGAVEVEGARRCGSARVRGGGGISARRGVRALRGRGIFRKGGQRLDVEDVLVRVHEHDGLPLSTSARAQSTAEGAIEPVAVSEKATRTRM